MSLCPEELTACTKRIVSACSPLVKELVRFAARRETGDAFFEQFVVGIGLGLSLRGTIEAYDAVQNSSTAAKNGLFNPALFTITLM